MGVELTSTPEHALTPEADGFDSAVFPVRHHLTPLKEERFDYRLTASPTDHALYFSCRAAS